MLFRRCARDLLELFCTIHNSFFNSVVEAKHYTEPLVVLLEGSGEKSKRTLVVVNPHRRSFFLQGVPLEFFMCYVKKIGSTRGKFVYVDKENLEVKIETNEGKLVEIDTIYFFYIPWQWYLYRLFGRSFFYARIIGTIIHELRHDQQHRDPQLNLLSTAGLVGDNWWNEFLKEIMEDLLRRRKHTCKKEEQEMEQKIGRKVKVRYDPKNEEDATLIEIIATNVWKESKKIPLEAKIQKIKEILQLN